MIIDNLLIEYLKENKSIISTDDVVSFLQENKEFKNEIRSIANINNYVNRTLYKFKLDNIVENISKGKFIYIGNKEVIKEGVVKKFRALERLKEHSNSIGELALKLEFEKDWFIEGVTLEQYLGINIQRGSGLKIILSKKPYKGIKDFLQSNNIHYTYLQTTSDYDAKLMAVIKLISEKKYSKDSIFTIYKFMDKDKYDLYDLLNYSLVTHNWSRDLAKWREIDVSMQKQQNFKENFVLLSSIWKR